MQNSMPKADHLAHRLLSLFGLSLAEAHKAAASEYIRQAYAKEELEDTVDAEPIAAAYLDALLFTLKNGERILSAKMQHNRTRKADKARKYAERKASQTHKHLHPVASINPSSN